MITFTEYISEAKGEKIALSNKSAVVDKLWEYMNKKVFKKVSTDDVNVLKSGSSYLTIAYVFTSEDYEMSDKEESMIEKFCLKTFDCSSVKFGSVELDEGLYNTIVLSD